MDLLAHRIWQRATADETTAVAMRQSIRAAQAFAVFVFILHAQAQVPPARSEIAQYKGLFAAALANNVAEIKALIAKGEPVDARDNYQRTPLHAAAYFARHDAMRALIAAGANPNALEHDRYDIITIASVANDVPTLKLALELGCKATNITSRYDGTALIAAAHLGDRKSVV